uniref:THAP domaincontaining protein 9like [Acyrthosiphon pisum] n=1 Tax=Lepeophtheirus salmonis TaxID=72036 RepID=A0A0K2SZE4_LEPSM
MINSRIRQHYLRLIYQVKKKKFHRFIERYEVLERSDGMRVIDSRRRTCPLGLISYIYSLRHLMKSGGIKLEYICCYKLQQDHLEHLFAAIIQRKGPQQFRFAFRKILCHAGKEMIHNINNNCVHQDDTLLWPISNRNN